MPRSSCCSGSSERSMSGELAPFDLVVLLILSECVQGALTAGDNSVTAGVIAASCACSARTRSSATSLRAARAWSAFFEGKPKILVRNGNVCKDVLAREQITHSELIEALRREGARLTKVRTRSSNDGHISTACAAILEGVTRWAPRCARRRRDCAAFSVEPSESVSGRHSCYRQAAIQDQTS